jgi:uncharacterized protein YndB with AHSA1/START domain
MPGIKLTRHVEAPPEKVFATATDFAGAPQFIRAIREVEMLTDGPVGIGTRFRETRVMLENEATEEMEVTAFDPPRSYALGTENYGTRFRTEFTFTPNGDGTDVEMSFEATPQTAVAKMMASALAPMIEKLAEECEKDLDDLKAAAESR